MTQVFGNDATTVDATDTEFLIKDDIDPTKILKLQVSGLTTGTTRTLTVPDADGTIAIAGAAGIVSIDGVANAGGDVDLVAGSTKVSITPDDALNKITLDVVEANLTLSNIGGAVTDAQVPNTITIDNLTQVTTRSHTALSDIGTNTHAQIDAHVAVALASGTYSPTLVNVANLDASAGQNSQYMRVGSVVTVSGAFTADITTAGVSSQLRIPLPIASNFTAGNQCGGTFVSANAASICGVIEADITNDQALCTWIQPSTPSNITYSFIFTYVIA